MERTPLDPTLTALQRTAWIRFAIVSHGIPAELNSRLLARNGLTQFEYLVLNYLHLADDGTMPMTRLAALTASSPSRLSHVVAKLERDGRVLRTRSETDRRVQLATVTASGTALFRSAAPGYFAAVHELFVEPLNAGDFADLDRIMGKLLPGIDAGGELAPIAAVVGRGGSPTEAAVDPQTTS